MPRPGKVTDRGKFQLPQKSREEKCGSRKPREYFLIVTNGEKTERNYFEYFKRKMPRGTVCIQVAVENGDPDLIAQKTLECVQNRKYRQYDHFATVFDKDDFAKQFDKAVARLVDAQDKYPEKTIYAAYSNECFELWMLLHFQEVHAALGRKNLAEKLEEHLQKVLDKQYRYDKGPFSFDLLMEHGDQREAIRRAKSLLTKAKNTEKPWQTNPSTNIHALIEKLNEFLDES